MVHFKPGNIEWLKMQTRKRFLQETKKCFKVRLALEDCISPMKARETFKKDLHVPSPFTRQAAWCYSGQSEISSFPSKKLKFFFPHSIRSLLLSKMVYLSWEECKTTDVIERKKKPFKILVLRQKFEGKKTNISFGF